MKDQRKDEYVQSIIKDGYALIPDVLTEEECDIYVKLLERDYKQYADHYQSSGATVHGLNNKCNEKVVYNMHNKDMRYFNLFDHCDVFPVIKEILQTGSYQNNESVNLLNISARNPAPYAEPQQLHLDSNLPGKGGYPLILVALFMLEDFTEVNGATRILPGSHRFDRYAEDGKVYTDEVTVTGKRGSVLLFDGALWHGSSKKYDDSSRWAVILGYGRWFIKPSFDFSRNIPEKIYSSLNEERKCLLGLDSNPPLDEFTRITRRCDNAEWYEGYELPK
ncbi:phytanoyl-CoA dioxygenase family protein [Aliamphritea spongicola]|uniref:phytanoyl-CoA dioxygenase family protein n=1 Tax=Aliamphritea spongicola TaxID=707589 RepID=UPI00196A41E8|nr:phytanoyl-CoA dioxygenase family protein [Aliamphritea spongicola]MBN3563490.1 phytanoyl-CoA dioxygenase family protein [Aliamphritea spongicola]